MPVMIRRARSDLARKIMRFLFEQWRTGLDPLMPKGCKEQSWTPHLNLPTRNTAAQPSGRIKQMAPVNSNVLAKKRMLKTKVLASDQGNR